MKVMLTDKFCERAKPGEWHDEKATGLSLLAGKTRKTWYLHVTQGGKRKRENLGGYPAMSLAEARRMVVEGKDSLETSGELPAKPGVVTYGAAVDDFIELYAKPRQRTWDETQRVLKSLTPWLNRDIATITPPAAYKLLEGFIAEGHPSKAAVTQRWLKTFWKWAYRRGTAPENMMDRVEVEVEKRERDRVFSPEEIRATWAAAEALGGEAEAFTKLLILLAPRKTALASLTAEDIADAVWTVPFELTKSRKKSSKKRVYIVPLSDLAVSALSGIWRSGRLFPSIPVHTRKSGRPMFHGNDLKLELVAHGAPEDFTFHGWRHTIATWLEDAGHSEWERGLVLNHSGSGSVTAGYSHGYPLELKRSLLEKWAGHVREIVDAK